MTVPATATVITLTNEPAWSPALANALHRGIEFHRAGNFPEAERAYVKVLEGKPTCFEALHFISVARVQQNRFHDALQPASAAVRCQPSHADALALLGVVYAGLNRHNEAIGAYDRVLAVRRDSIETICNRAASLAHLGRAEEAAMGYRRALALRPGHPPALLNLGNVLAGLRRFDEALACYDELLRQGIVSPGLANNIGNVLFELGRGEDALVAYADALARSPDQVEPLRNTGKVLLSLKRYQESLAYFDRVLQMVPDHLGALAQRGRALAELGRHAEALENFDAALAQELADITILNNRCVALQHLSRFDEALAAAQQTLAVDARNAVAYYNLGNVLQALNRFEEAVAAYQNALVCSPDAADVIDQLGGEWLGMERPRPMLALSLTASDSPSTDMISLTLDDSVTNEIDNSGDGRGGSTSAAELGVELAEIVKNMGGAWLGLERHNAAIACLEQAIAMGADDDQTRTNKSLAYLNIGRFAEGWADYDCRLSQANAASRRYPQARWDGEHVDGTLLVWGEQGLGDQIIYASMIEEAASCAVSVVLEVEPRLVPLFSRSFPMIDVIAIKRELYAGDFAAQIPIGSLGRYLRPDWQSFTQPERGFLRADPVRTAELRDRLHANRRQVIGLSWRSQNNKHAKSKTALLRDFEAILRLPNCRFIDLQYGDTSEERQVIEQELGVRVENLADIDNTNDIDGLAALICACDKVVTVSNTTAHLAGALGRETIVVLPAGHARMWYWFKGHDDSPWYPGVRLKRLGAGQSWAEAVAAVADELSASSAPQSRSA
jgi:tetratricopeptide (TPR) repeat protein